MQLQNHHLYPSRRSAILARNMVAASQPLVVRAGLKMCYMGANAVDAALATAITLTLIEPKGCGSGLMMLYRVCLTAPPQTPHKSLL